MPPAGRGNRAWQSTVLGFLPYTIAHLERAALGSVSNAQSRQRFTHKQASDADPNQVGCVIGRSSGELSGSSQRQECIFRYGCPRADAETGVFGARSPPRSQSEFRCRGQEGYRTISGGPTDFGRGTISGRGRFSPVPGLSKPEEASPSKRGRSTKRRGKRRIESPA